MPGIIEKIVAGLDGVTGKQLFRDFGGKIPVFVFRVPDQPTLERSWSKISSRIAASYQSKLDLEAEFERWNIYILFLVNGKVEKRVSGEIEQDRFVGRKFVIEHAGPNTKFEPVIDRFVTGAYLVTGLEKTGNSGRRARSITASRGRKVRRTEAEDESLTATAPSHLQMIIGENRIEGRNAKNREELEYLLDAVEYKYLKLIRNETD